MIPYFELESRAEELYDRLRRDLGHLATRMPHTLCSLHECKRVLSQFLECHPTLDQFYLDVEKLLETKLSEGHGIIKDSRPIHQDYTRCVPGAVEKGWPSSFISNGEVQLIDGTKLPDTDVRPMARFDYYDVLAMQKFLTVVKTEHSRHEDDRASWYAKVEPTERIDAPLNFLGRYIDGLLGKPEWNGETTAALIEGRLLRIFVGSEVHFNVIAKTEEETGAGKRKRAEPSSSTTTTSTILSKETLVLLPRCLSYHIRSPPMGVFIKRTCVKLGVLSNGTAAVYADGDGVYMVGEGGRTHKSLRCTFDTSLVNPHGFCVKIASSVARLFGGTLDVKDFDTKQLVLLPDVNYSKSPETFISETPCPIRRNLGSNFKLYKRTWCYPSYSCDYRRAARHTLVEPVCIKGLDYADDDDMDVEDDDSIKEFNERVKRLQCHECEVDSTLNKQSFVAYFKHSDDPPSPKRLCSNCVKTLPDDPRDLKIPCISLNQHIDSL
ncbi:hypothetical protein [Crucian carp herpesvirus]|uniref:ORF53 n=1 Tax=Cyprinid herpesvirus 2 TaxID=317878 RepID=K7PCB8_CYHV2|nr:protein ORF53 [Cyprinid herpesvirus 2]APD51569.1 hypothetical protein [Crucian carp herpesvirus]AFJ20487.1 protein ORF53 [Cyprinid herpesvirus 2]AKC02002.1 hypothetical protein [Cyprinid herpesvirus 2]AMB21624.1 ORF53 [Cyprinid herpesvirus 2]QAU54778.1 protein ORF53 [Cyprinid herpesvirus 2]